MSKKILIDTSNGEETRVAVTENGKLDNFEIESNKKTAVKGDVYLAKITRIEPSLQSAFVDFGANRNGFLPLTEIHPDYFKIPSADQNELSKLTKKLQNIENINDGEEIINGENSEISNDESKLLKNNPRKINPRKIYYDFFRKYKIQDVIKPKQIILVQINKEERSLKGAALTTFLSFAGRYCVLMPNSMNNDGISRKIGDIEERNKLKAILSSINIPEKMSVIVRTAGIGKTKKEISKDLTYLTSQWNKIRETTLKAQAPKLIYEEGSILKRTIRDMITEDVESIIVDGKEGFEKIKKLTKNLVPNQTKNIKLFKSKEKTLFSDNNIENQINDLFSLNVKLESGGSIVINTTEALVSIDVNSGKNTSERNIENTALKTNLEAAVEIARQLRLRDLGGLIVIDFIDMDDYRNNFKVEKTLKTALFRDRARIQVGRISMFGLLELSRQRLRSSLIERSFEKCPYCRGSGLILNINSISEQIIKVLHEKLSNNENLKINVKCNTALAETLINSKKQEIFSLENKYNSKINFIFNNHYSLHEPLIDTDSKLVTKKIKLVTKKIKLVTKEIKTKKKKINSKIEKKKINSKKTKKKISKNSGIDKTDNLKEIKQQIGIENNQISQDEVMDKNTEEKKGWWS